MSQIASKSAEQLNREYRAKKRRLFIKTLFSRKIVLVSAIILLFIILTAILADVIMPYNPNQLSIKERSQGPSATHILGTDE